MIKFDIILQYIGLVEAMLIIFYKKIMKLGFFDNSGFFKSLINILFYKMVKNGLTKISSMMYNLSCQFKIIEN